PAGSAATAAATEEAGATAAGRRRTARTRRGRAAPARAPSARAVIRPRREGLVMRKLAFLLVPLVLLAAAPARADDVVARYQLGGNDTPHVGLPFLLDLAIQGFDESPTPVPPKLEIANAKVTFLSAEKEARQSVQIVINGQVTRSSSSPLWVLHWKIEPS